MRYKGLDTKATFTLIMEVDESVALAQAGLRTLRGLHHVVEDHAAVLTLLSIAAEKLLKLGIGVTHLADGDGWPSRSVMRGHGHHIVKMNQVVTQQYRTRVARSTAPGFIQQLLTESEDDPHLLPLLDLLDRWGTQARFHRLDELAGNPQSGESAQNLWQELENSVLDEDPELLELLGTPAGFDESRRTVNATLVTTYTAWWKLHTRAWMTGVIGDDAKALATALDRVVSPPAGRDWD